jgi:hypothetical protein
VDAELSPLQLAVLNAAAEATNVRRPTADFEVGDTVVISGSGNRNYTDAISKIGRMWITVGEGNRAKRFDRTTLCSEHKTGAGLFDEGWEDTLNGLVIWDGVEGWRPIIETKEV